MSKVKEGRLIINGTGVIIQSDVRVIGFVGIASANDSACELVDIDGDTIWECGSSIAGKRFFSSSLPNDIKCVRLECLTFTNMKKVIVYIG